jgi:hypothetical protein
MLLKNLITILFLFTCFTLSGQQSSFLFPKKQIDYFQSKALQKIKDGDTVRQFSVSCPGMVSGVRQMQQYYRSALLPQNYIHSTGKSFSRSDTLYIVDTMQITGTWVHTGAIVIANNGLLHFNKANVTILGDIFLLGEHPQLVADSSTLYIPQAYFYQRVVFATGGAKVTYRNTTVDHSGLSHNIILVDSARLELTNVINKGFTTNGIYNRATVAVNGINEAGEYVITDASTLSFRNATTVLLWHQFPEGAHINFTYPDGDTTYNYHFNKTISGVSGINYSITADSCYNVMWGMMPEQGTDITISDSKIRAVGLWFMGADTVNVSGLVDNSTYLAFDAPLSDRSLHLNNCSVVTWSLYPMEHSTVNIKNCIVGEVGAGGSSTVAGDQFFCDGSGGYVWSSDSSLLIAGFSYVSGYVRSQANSILYYAYSSLAGGYPSALQNSIIIVLQCMLLQEPKALDNSVAWYALINQPFEANVGEIVPVTGSVWIDKTPTSTNMDFGSYRLYYQISGDADWIEIPVDSLIEKRNETLGIWNTDGLPAGQYLLKLKLYDNWGNSAEAVKSVSLQPSFGITENDHTEFIISPNPAAGSITFKIPAGLSDFSIKIADIAGKTVLNKNVSGFQSEENYTLGLGEIKSGSYLFTLNGRGLRYSCHFEVR